MWEDILTRQRHLHVVIVCKYVGSCQALICCWIAPVYAGIASYVTDLDTVEQTA